jgi:hypothetical protein
MTGHANNGGPRQGPPGRFFILGCQRSGTTLVRLVLECHPLVGCLDEQRAYRALALDEPLPADKLCLGFKVPRWTEVLAEPCFHDEQLGRTVAGVYRGEPLIFLLRDVRDTVASMLRLPANRRQSWLDFWGRRELARQMQSPAFRDRFGREIERLHAGGEAAHLAGALYWKYKTQAYFDYSDHGWPVCPVRYEDLVAAPEHHLRRVLGALDVPWHPGVLDHPQFPHTEVSTDGTTTGKTDPRRPIDARSVGQWRRDFSAEEEAGIRLIVGDLNDQVAGMSFSVQPGQSAMKSGDDGPYQS